MIARSSAARILVAVSVALVPAQLSFATYDFTVVALRRELGLSIDQINAVQLIPTAAALVIVFVAGRLAELFGSKRLIAGGAALFSIGTLLNALAQSLPMLVIGRALEGMGGTSMAIASLALLESTFNGHPRRGAIYGFYAAVAPTVFVIGPLLGVELAGLLGWRILPAMSCAAGAGALLIAITCVPPQPVVKIAVRDLGVPLLAGLVAALTGACVMTLGGIGSAAPAAAMAVLAAAGLVLLARSGAARAGLAVATASLRLSTAWRALVALFLLRSIDMPFFTTILLQDRYGAGLVESAWLMLPCQVASIVGGVLGGTLMARWGARRAAVGVLAVTAATALVTLPLGGDAPAWQAIVSVSLIGAANMAALAALTAHIMSKPARGSEGGMASVFNLSENAGIVLGGVLAGLIVFGALESGLAGHLDRFTALSLEHARLVAAQIRAGANIQDLRSYFNLPQTGAFAAGVESAWAEGWADAYRVAVLLCLLTNAAAAATLWRLRKAAE